MEKVSGEHVQTKRGEKMYRLSEQSRCTDCARGEDVSTQIAEQMYGLHEEKMYQLSEQSRCIDCVRGEDVLTQ